jgi:hypothetical protein
VSTTSLRSPRRWASQTSRRLSSQGEAPASSRIDHATNRV